MSPSNRSAPTEPSSDKDTDPHLGSRLRPLLPASLKPPESQDMTQCTLKTQALLSEAWGKVQPIPGRHWDHCTWRLPTTASVAREKSGSSQNHVQSTDVIVDDHGHSPDTARFVLTRNKNDKRPWLCPTHHVVYNPKTNDGTVLSELGFVCLGLPTIQLVTVIGEDGTRKEKVVAYDMKEKDPDAWNQVKEGEGEFFESDSLPEGTVNSMIKAANDRSECATRV